jgi:DNA processing protein
MDRQATFHSTWPSSPEGRLLAIAELPGIGPASIRRLIQDIGGWDHLAAVPSSSLTERCRMVNRRQTWDMADLDAGIATARSTLEATQAAGAYLMTPAHPDWPHQVDRLGPDAPLWLYIRGRSDILHASAIAVIGTRQPTSFGARCADRFGHRVAEAGAVVVSGLALGCDGAAHTGALAAHGTTVAVLPCPINQVVPNRHAGLAGDILASGALISEYPPTTDQRIPSYYFVARDRIQAGLVRGVIVTETALDGGTMHAVHAAQRMGIPIACLASDDPAWSQEQVTAGNRALIADRAATPLQAAADLQAWLRDCLSASPQ